MPVTEIVPHPKLARGTLVPLLQADTASHVQMKRRNNQVYRRFIWLYGLVSVALRRVIRSRTGVIVEGTQDRTKQTLEFSLRPIHNLAQETSSILWTVSALSERVQQHAHATLQPINFSTVFPGTIAKVNFPALPIIEFSRGHIPSSQLFSSTQYPNKRLPSFLLFFAASCHTCP